jgi:putative aldouronate transport system permease protein
MNVQPTEKSKQHILRQPGDRIFSLVNVLIMLGFCTVILFPVLNVISVSVSNDYYIYTGSVTFYPRGFELDAYRQVLKSGAIWRSFGNSVFVAVVACVLSLTMTSFAAYPLVFADFYGKKVYNFMILLTMWFSGGLIPTYMVVSRLGLINSLFALILVPMIGAYNVIIMRSFYQSIPATLVESARIDGAQDFRVLFQIVIPLSKAALATIGLWIIVARWNEFMGPIIFLKDYKKYTLQVLLRDVVLAANAHQYGIAPEGDEVNLIPEQIRNATIVVTMFPVLCVYPFLQKYFVKGVMLGAVKE